jgi:lysozyme
MSYLKFLDLSHYQGVIDASSAALIAQLYDGVIIKATQGTTFVDPDLVNNVQVFRPLESDSFFVGLYHFSDAGNPAAEAQHFLNSVWPLAAGEIVVLDFEDEIYANPGVWSWGWMLTVNVDPRTNHLLGMEYTTRSIITVNPDGNDWTAIKANCPIWIADPGADPNAQTTYNGVPVPYTVDMEQYGEAAVPGIVGLVDQDAAYFSSVTAVKKCGFQPVVAATPVAPEQAVTLAQSPPPPTPPVVVPPTEVVVTHQTPGATVVPVKTTTPVSTPPSSASSDFDKEIDKLFDAEVSAVEKNPVSFWQKVLAWFRNK